jgi:hypothetical protein
MIVSWPFEIVLGGIVLGLPATQTKDVAGNGRKNHCGSGAHLLVALNVMTVAMFQYGNAKTQLQPSARMTHRFRTASIGKNPSARVPIIAAFRLVINA